MQSLVVVERFKLNRKDPAEILLKENLFLFIPLFPDVWLSAALFFNVFQSALKIMLSVFMHFFIRPLHYVHL